MAPAIKTALKLLIACFFVGLVLSWIDFSALDVLRSLSAAVHATVEWFAENFGRAFEIILLGAVVVLPLALLQFGLKRLKGRRRPPPKGGHG